MHSPAPARTRRAFLRQLLGLGVAGLAGYQPLLGQTPPPLSGAEAFRFAFLTDIHLLRGNLFRSAQGLAACLAAVEKLDPKPDFILVGGDLVDRAREMPLILAEQQLRLFRQIWNDNTSLPAHWVFGNHDLAGTSLSNSDVSDARYAKGLFREVFQLPRLTTSFDWKGWHFVILDDVSLQPDHTYIGAFERDELAFLRTDLDAHRTMPTLVTTHIPLTSGIPLPFYEMTSADNKHPQTFLCTNPDDFYATLPGHNIRGVLAGHLHHLELIKRDGLQLVNSGAVCGNYWRGPMLGTVEGFGVVDLSADGTMTFNYRDYGWKT
jgi:predicted MPP superfamily phosphohydrolase